MTGAPGLKDPQRERPLTKENLNIYNETVSFQNLVFNGTPIIFYFGSFRLELC